MHLLTRIAEGLVIPDMHSRDKKFIEYSPHSRQRARYTDDPARYILFCSLLSILAHGQLSSNWSSCFISQGPHCLGVMRSKHNNSRTKRKAQQQESASCAPHERGQKSDNYKLSESPCLREDILESSRTCQQKSEIHFTSGKKVDRKLPMAFYFF